MSLKVPTCLEMIGNDEELLLICMLCYFLVFGTAQDVNDGRPLVDARAKVGCWVFSKVTISRRESLCGEKYSKSSNQCTPQITRD